MSTDSDWWRSSIFYNLYVRSFNDTNSDGIGDLQGVIEKLDYLHATLGVDVIYLSGMLMSPWAEFGFDISDYQAIHPRFGTLDTIDGLLREAHERGMKVLVDWVPNHTSSQHPWFIESRSSRDNPKRDWYFWRDPNPDGTPPNNWLSLFGGPAWEWDENTWQYYLHTFLKQQPDLNWRNPQVREAMFGAVRFWLERGVDGFRVDAAHHIMKDSELRDNPPAEQVREIAGKKLAHEFQQHVNDREQSDVHAVYRDLRRILDEYSSEQPRIAIAEVHVSGWEAWSQFFGTGDEFTFPLNPGFISVQWDAGEVRKLVDEVEAATPAGLLPNAHTGNFDEWRVASRFGRDAARAAAMLLLTMRGVPVLYYGEEIGMVNVDVPKAMAQDPFGKRMGLSRDPQRTPMQWDDSPNAGFSAGEPWLPVPEDYAQYNVVAELEDPRSMLNLYRRLIACRHETPALIEGSYRPLDGTPAPVYAYLREHSGDAVSGITPDRLLVALNFSDLPQMLSLADLGAGELLLNTYLDRAGPLDLAHLEVGAHEGLLIRLES